MVDLILKDLSVGYQKTLISNISIEIPLGQLIGVVGRNGSGKSTLGKTLLKIEPPLTGDILYKNKSIARYSTQEWATVFSAVFSRVPSVPHIRVTELIDLGCNENKLLKEQIIEQLGIGFLLQNFGDEISDGQLQKVFIARALYQDTPYVLLDEPTAHLDYIAKRETFELLKKIVEKTEKTLLIISHEMDYIKEYSNCIYMIGDKKLITL